jgi:hypothetical protein
MPVLDTIKQMFGAKDLGMKARNSFKLNKTSKLKRVSSKRSLGSKAVNSLKLVKNTLKKKRQLGG